MSSVTVLSYASPVGRSCQSQAGQPRVGRHRPLVAYGGRLVGHRELTRRAPGGRAKRLPIESAQFCACFGESDAKMRRHLRLPVCSRCDSSGEDSQSSVLSRQSSVVGPRSLVGKSPVTKSSVLTHEIGTTRQSQSASRRSACGRPHVRSLRSETPASGRQFGRQAPEAACSRSRTKSGKPSPGG